MAIVNNAPSGVFQKIIDDRESRSDPHSASPDRILLHPVEIFTGYESFKKFSVPEPALCSISGSQDNLDILLANLTAKAKAEATGKDIRSTHDFMAMENSLAFVNTVTRQYRQVVSRLKCKVFDQVTVI